VDANLTRPEGDERAEGETIINRGGPHLGKGGAERSGEGTGRAGLDLDLEHFHRAQSEIGEDLSRGGTSEPDSGLVLLRQLFASQVHVRILEHFIETVLEHSLERVADKCGTEAFPDTL